MSTTRTSTIRRHSDHFQPDDVDPQDARRLRGQLEAIDYAAFAANREVLAQSVGQVTMQSFQRMAVAAALARGKWIREAMAMSADPTLALPQRVQRLTELRQTFEELGEAYEAMRRMVERGYVTLAG